MSRDKRWITYCLKKAERHQVNNPYRHIACLVVGGKLLKVEGNKTKAGELIDPIYKDRQSHAELMVLCELDPDEIKGAILYVAGWKCGKAILSKPCRHCQEYLKKFNLKSVVYSLPDGRFEKMSV
nr:hypothetical protein [Mycobacterium sp. E3298]